MTLKANSLDGIASGTAVTSSNSGGTSGVAFDGVSGSVFAQSTSAYAGASGLAITALASYDTPYVYWFANGGATRSSFSFYFKYDVAPSAGAAVQLANSGALQVFLTDTGAVKVYNSSGVGASNPVKATSTALVAGTWYFMQFASRASSAASASAEDGQFEARIYRASDALAMLEYDSGSTVGTGYSSYGLMVFGRFIYTPPTGVGTAPTNTTVLSFDQLAWTDSLPTQNFPVASTTVAKDQDFNSLSNGATVSTSSPTSVTGTTTAEPENGFDYGYPGTGASLTASTASPYGGSGAALVAYSPATGTDAYVGWLASAGAVGLRAATSFAFRLDTLPTTGAAILLEWGSLYVAATPTGALKLSWTAADIHTTVPLSTGTWYVAQVALWPGSKSTSVNDSRIELTIRAASGAVVDSYDPGFTLAGNPSVPSAIYFGNDHATAPHTGAVQYAFDNLHYRPDWPGGFPGPLLVGVAGGSTVYTVTGSDSAAVAVAHPAANVTTAVTGSDSAAVTPTGAALRQATADGTVAVAVSASPATATAALVAAVAAGHVAVHAIPSAVFADILASGVTTDVLILSSSEAEDEYVSGHTGGNLLTPPVVVLVDYVVNDPTLLKLLASEDVLVRFGIRDSFGGQGLPRATLATFP